MTLTIKQQILILLGTAVISFAAGRYTSSYHSKTETKTTDKKVITDDKTEKKKVHKKTTIVKNPDGSSTTTITEDDDTNEDDDSKTTNDKTTDKTKEVSRSGSGLGVFAMISRDPLTGNLVYGAQVQKDILGPFVLGGFGLTNGNFGLELGLRF